MSPGKSEDNDQEWLCKDNKGGICEIYISKRPVWGQMKDDDDDIYDNNQW